MRERREEEVDWSALEEGANWDGTQDWETVEGIGAGGAWSRETTRHGGGFYVFLNVCVYPFFAL